MVKLYRCKSRDGKRDVLIEDTKANAHRLKILRDAGYIITDETPTPPKEKVEKKSDPVKEAEGKAAPSPSKGKSGKKEKPVKETDPEVVAAPSEDKAGLSLVDDVLFLGDRELATIPNEELEAFCEANGIESESDPLVAIEDWFKADTA